MHDYHAHSLYSDGGHFERMLDAATAAGLEGVGFADHCSVTTNPHWRRRRARYHRNFDLTYERRREALSELRQEYDLEIYDAVEIDYEADAEDRIGRFLDSAAFRYSIGSVHYVRGRPALSFESFADETTDQRRQFVDAYYQAVTDLIESELFEIAAHVDLPESHPDLAGLTTSAHARKIADAFDNSRTIPELNAGQSVRDNPADFHPGGTVLETLLDHGISFTVGTDAHEPDHFTDCVPALRRKLGEMGIEPSSLL